MATPHTCLIRRLMKRFLNVDSGKIANFHFFTSSYPQVSQVSIVKPPAGSRIPCPRIPDRAPKQDSRPRTGIGKAVFENRDTCCTLFDVAANAPPKDPQLLHDEEYFHIMASALKVCAEYKPMFGQGRAGGGLTLEQFRKMYGADPFYSWIGLDSPMMYAAHKAAGGMTSIYRQIGIGGQWVFNKVLQHTLGLNEVQANWTYEVPTTEGMTRKLSLDGRIELTDVADKAKRDRVKNWMNESLKHLKVDRSHDNAPKKGVVFEVRQGYKSKDAKRQNADIANAAHAYVSGYMPSVVLLSLQIDGDIATRYTEARWLLLIGSKGGGPIGSTYAFCREVLGYDLAGFFERNSKRLKIELDKVLEMLLKPDGD